MYFFLLQASSFLSYRCYIHNLNSFFSFLSENILQTFEKKSQTGQKCHAIINVQE